MPVYTVYRTIIYNKVGKMIFNLQHTYGYSLLKIVLFTLIRYTNTDYNNILI